ncbi:MAG: winged helix-turn-helix transcriptional regulator [Armatimonadetes bacterium]|nr:winged helix DNA-binding protein [Armatimonadota bacterium]MBS1703080.1 winged helix-turn-helix transcriptional regulator [Armatimonadota bacterium]MBS1727647.1 winged helix-turn-helix transcriptional regulator [Armatimonadota bacterium]
MKYIDKSASPAYQLWLVTNTWQRAVRKILEPFEITHCQFVIMASVNLLENEGKLPTQVAVHRFAAIDENMTSQVVKTLINKGLVVRHPHPTDGRGHVLGLTESGEKLLDEVRGVIRPAADEFFSPLGDDVKQLTGLLHRLNENHMGARGCGDK